MKPKKKFSANNVFSIVIEFQNGRFKEKRLGKIIDDSIELPVKPPKEILDTKDVSMVEEYFEQVLLGKV